MRTEFHSELDRLTTDLGEMCRTAGDLADSATTALVTADCACAAEVSAGYAHLHLMEADLRGRAVALLALQAPVARDLRVVVTGIQIAAGAERMGGLAANVANLARRHHPDVAVPELAVAHFSQMGGVAVTMAQQVSDAVVTSDVERACGVAADDQIMDDLHRRLFGLLTDAWPHCASVAADMVLLSRFYERFADHAVAIAGRIVFAAKGHSLIRDEALVAVPTRGR